MHNIDTKLIDKIDNLLITEKQIDSYQADDDHAMIQDATDFIQETRDEIRNSIDHSGLNLPWLKTRTLVNIRPSELSLWSGYRGHKKSMLLGQVVFDLINQGETACIASFEMKPHKTLKRMLFQAVGNNNPSDAFIDKFFDYVHTKLFIYNAQNKSKPQRVLNMVRYCVNELKLKHVVVDSLMMCGVGKDLEKQSHFISELAAIANNSDSHIHLVTHMRKPPENRRYIPDGYDIAGDADITNMAHNVFIVWSNKDKEDELKKPLDKQRAELVQDYDIKLIVDKQRDGDFEGKFGLYFDRHSLQAVEHEGRRNEYL